MTTPASATRQAGLVYAIVGFASLAAALVVFEGPLKELLHPLRPYVKSAIGAVIGSPSWNSLVKNMGFGYQPSVYEFLHLWQQHQQDRLKNGGDASGRPSRHPRHYSRVQARTL